MLQAVMVLGQSSSLRRSSQLAGRRWRGWRGPGAGQLYCMAALWTSDCLRRVVNKSGTLESAATKLGVRSPQLDIASRVSCVAGQSSKIAARSSLLEDRIWKLQLAARSLQHGAGKNQRLEARSSKIEAPSLLINASSGDGAHRVKLVVT